MFTSNTGQDQKALCLLQCLKGIEIFLSIIVGGRQEEPGGKEFVIGSGFEEDKESCKVKRIAKKRTFLVKTIYILDVDLESFSN